MKRPWHQCFVAVFMIFIYSMGIRDFFMMLTHNEAYYASLGYGEAFFAYFTNYPIHLLVLWISNLLCGFVAPVLLLMNKKLSQHLALISASSNSLLLLLTFAFRDRWNILGSRIAAFDFFILLITFGLFLYCVHMNKKGYLQ